MHFQKLLAVCILLISCHGAIASPLNIGGASPGGGLRAVTSNTASSDDDKVVELERRAEDKKAMVAIGWVISGPNLRNYGVVFHKVPHSIVKRDDGKLSYYKLSGHEIEEVRFLDSKVQFPARIDVSAEISALEAATEGVTGCEWIMKALDFWQRRSGHEDSHQSKQDLGRSIAERERELHIIPSTCDVNLLSTVQL
ncbi:hypothetical protein DFJ43DRAFT_1083651 [Lentinula guzmanii]|uniref:Uncharacterized protein n=1 Tax=Lentinula guzmanii TaxID=2804957 RepID=A0AA38JNB2_9AGAR|nr:hypothetical protein DFJ43DRAFT_1083651 [Lentinula guzmanii]